MATRWKIVTPVDDLIIKQCIRDFIPATSSKQWGILPGKLGAAFPGGHVYVRGSLSTYPVDHMSLSEVVTQLTMSLMLSSRVRLVPVVQTAPRP